MSHYDTYVHVINEIDKNPLYMYTCLLIQYLDVATIQISVGTLPAFQDASFDFGEEISTLQ